MLDVKLKIKPGHTNERSWMTPAPVKTFFWNVTYRCNYHCGICFTDAGGNRDDELTTVEAKDLIRTLHNMGIRDLILSGGEPFMRKDIDELLAFMGDLEITARIATNGYPLSQERLEFLRNKTRTKSFQVSLDTLDPGKYDRFHGSPGGAIHKVLENLSLMKSMGFHTTVSVRLTPETLPGINDILDRAALEGWATVTIHFPLHTNRTENSYSQDEEFFEILKPVFEHFLKIPHWLIETYIPWAEYHPVVKRFREKIRFVHRGCSAGRDHFTISPAGWLSPCVCMDLPEVYLGNVREKSPEELIRDSSLCKMFRKPWDYGICRDCELVTKCGGGCRAAAFSMTGRLDGLDGTCPVRKARKTGDALVK